MPKWYSSNSCLEFSSASECLSVKKNESQEMNKSLSERVGVKDVMKKKSTKSSGGAKKAKKTKSPWDSDIGSGILVSRK